MTISISPLTVATSISNLVVTGITIKDVDKIPASGSMICPIIFPQPSGFITNMKPEAVSFGSMGTQKENLTYTLNYVFLYSEVGGGLGAFAPYQGMLQKLVATINVIMNNDVVSGLVDMQLGGISGLGSIQDPSGKMYWGALFSLNCLEFSQ